MPRIAISLSLVIVVASWPTSMSAQEPRPATADINYFTDAANHLTVPGDSELRRLMKERFAVAAREWQAAASSNWTATRRMAMAERIFNARLALADNPAAEIKLRQQYIPFIEQIEKQCKELHDAGGIKKQWLLRAQYARVDAVVQLGLLRDSLPGTTFALPMVSIEELIDREDQSGVPEFLKYPFQSIKAGDTDLQKLKKLRANLAVAEVNRRWSEVVERRGIIEDQRECVRLLRDSQWALAITAVERQEILTRHLQFHQAVFDALKETLGCLKPGAGAGYIYAIETAKLDLLRSAPDRPVFGKLPATVISLPPPDAPAEAPDDLHADREEPPFARANLFSEVATDSQLLQLYKQRHNSANRIVHFRFQEYRVGRGTLDDLMQSARVARNVRQELTGDPKQRTNILTEYCDFMRAINNLNQARFDVGAIRQQDMEQTRYERLTAEIDLMQAKAKSK